MTTAEPRVRAQVHDHSAALRTFASGTVIPAQPLALTEGRALDERRQRALSRYYLESGAGGIAVGVHSTQFAIHDAHRRLLRPVLELAAEEVHAAGTSATVLVAGICGSTAEAVAEAELAHDLGYDAALLAPYGAGAPSEAALLRRAGAVGQVLPVIGFYLQPSIGGGALTREFWRELADLDCVIGIKVAPFDRYRTADVLWGVSRSRRHDAVALYTGNDDHVIGDLLTTYPTPDGGELRFVGGLLGQWSLWTSQAVNILRLSRQALAGNVVAWRELQRMEVALTDANGAIFDARNDFRGCIPGIHEVLRRQGLLAGVWCLDPDERLSGGQLADIDRVWSAYPQLRDDAFVTANRSRWLDMTQAEVLLTKDRSSWCE